MIDRAEWDVYFLAIAKLVSMRSIDTSTKCGCVLVSKDNRILSTGYNGPIRGMKDENVPMVRPYKYHYMIHSEINALLLYSGSYEDIKGGTCYITTKPCSDCLRSIIQKGISRIVYCEDTEAVMVSNMSPDLKIAYSTMIEETKTQITTVPKHEVEKLLVIAVEQLKGLSL